MNPQHPNEPKIYLLPNLMTAGNLFCGFAATLRIIEASLLAVQGLPTGMLYHEAIAFILGACVSASHPHCWFTRLCSGIFSGPVG
jgi:CDP-diacylglycerol--serine O-phosphatidyltransferase